MVRCLSRISRCRSSLAVQPWFAHKHHHAHGNEEHEQHLRIHECTPSAAVATAVSARRRGAGGERRSGQMAITVPTTMTNPPIHIQTTRGLTNTLKVATREGSK